MKNFQFKRMIALAVVVGALVVPTQALALVTHTDFASWETAALGDGLIIASVNIADTLASNNNILFAGNPLGLPFSETLTFDTKLIRREVPNGDWATWSNGKTPIVLVTKLVNVITATFDAPVVAFGVEMEPNQFSIFDMILTIEGGTMITQSVNGNAGAKFFGWTGGSVSSFTLECQGGCRGFAFAEMVKGEVPEPSTILLLGSGLVGLVAWRKRMLQV